MERCLLYVAVRHAPLARKQPIPVVFQSNLPKNDWPPVTPNRPFLISNYDQRTTAVLNQRLREHFVIIIPYSPSVRVRRGNYVSRDSKWTPGVCQLIRPDYSRR